MKLFFALFFMTAFSVFAQQDQKLSDGKWAYYGADFYTTMSSSQAFTREQISKILNSAHQPISGKLDTIVPDCEGSRTACYKHFSVGYDRARKIMFGELDMLKDEKGTYVVDVYCGRKVYFTSVDTVSGMHAQINIEHTWPQSRFNSGFSRDMQKSDMHHLFLADSQANATRGNSPFGFVKAIDDRSGGEGCRDSRTGLMDSMDANQVYTPPVGHRGNVARALFYFSMHYNLPISQSEEKTLREWHKADPVDANEIKRHEGIAKYEKVRNPFVDYPELVERVSDF